MICGVETDMGLSNYDKMLEAGRKLFLDYDQSTMVD